ncbi:MAG: hypothetical protein ACRDBQ_18925 [Shewanella sp.]
MTAFFSSRESALLEYAKTQTDPIKALRARMAESNIKISKEKIAVAFAHPREQWDAVYIQQLSGGSRHVAA